jgi:hypothetical protein
MDKPGGNDTAATEEQQAGPGKDRAFTTVVGAGPSKGTQEILSRMIDKLDDMPAPSLSTPGSAAEVGADVGPDLHFPEFPEMELKVGPDEKEYVLQDLVLAQVKQLIALLRATPIDVGKISLDMADVPGSVVQILEATPLDQILLQLEGKLSWLYAILLTPKGMSIQEKLKVEDQKQPVMKQISDELEYSLTTQQQAEVLAHFFSYGKASIIRLATMALDLFMEKGKK